MLTLFKSSRPDNDVNTNPASGCERNCWRDLNFFGRRCVSVAESELAANDFCQICFQTQLGRVALEAASWRSRSVEPRSRTKRYLL
jgi:hypothetical protein